MKTKILLATLSLLLAPLALALPSDRNQPIDVNADSASMDENSGLTVLTGAVKVVQGTMKITGKKLEIYRDKAGEISKMITYGAPATFQQQQQKGKPLTHAFGSKMVYLLAEQTVTITGNAKVEQDNDKFSGEKVVYYMDKAVVKATGGKQRVKMIIQPKGQK
ncbi:MAG: lipopolysaccharide transport periplasmic protein LptA [Pseudomonadales bacterium]